MTEPNRSIHKQISRRDFIKITAAMGGALLGGSLFHFFESPKQSVVHDSRLLMGTIINITLVAESQEQGQSAIQATYATMDSLTRFFDYRRTDSELGQLNQAGELAHPSTELVNVLKQAVHYSELSGGAFDVSVLPILNAYSANRPLSAQDLILVDYRNILIQADYIQLKLPGMAITLDGIAKGRVVDGGVTTLKKLGFSNILVEAGGDLLAQGKDPGGNPWKIGITNPRPSPDRRWLATFGVSDRAVATSGDYEHSFTSDCTLNHIIDPRTGLSPSELSSATVIASTVMDADALGTTLMVLGVKKSLELVEQLPDIEALLVTKDLQIFRSSGFPTI